MGTGGGGEYQVEVRDRLLEGVEQLGAAQDMVGAGRGALGGEIRPAVTGIDDPKPHEGKVAHRARSHADILAELRLDQDDHGAGKVVPRLGLVGAGHLTSLSDSTSEDLESGPEQADSRNFTPSLLDCPAGADFSSRITALRTFLNPARKSQAEGKTWLPQPSPCLPRSEPAVGILT